jgi:hypothetical protein
VSRRRSIGPPRDERGEPVQLPLVASPRPRAGVEPEQAAKVAITRRSKPLTTHIARFCSGAILLVACFATPAQSQGRFPLQALAESGSVAAADVPSASSPGLRWELTLDGGVGLPSGTLQVGETNARGTPLSIRHDLGITVSEAVEGSAAFHFTQRDALRLTFLYFFLNGSSTSSDSFVYNGRTFPPGQTHSTLEYAQLTLAYERELLNLGPGGQLVGSLGLTYVNLNAIVNNDPEDFFRQELPVPIAGLRYEYPVSDRVSVTATAAGGFLPRVPSGRQEGGTVYLQQGQANLGLGVAYRFTPALDAEVSYQFSYFTQHELSHEDNNFIRLFDNGFRLALSYRF